MLSLIRAGVNWLSRSLENPRRPLDPWSNAMGDTIEGDLSTAGVRVSLDKALTVPAFWRGVSLISRTCAKLPLGVFRHVRPGREPDREHPAHWLLMRQPNEVMTPFVYKQLMVAQAVTEGNHYSYVVRDAGNRPAELWPLDPARTYPLRVDRKLWYVHELKGGEKRKLPAGDVLHVKGLGFDGLQGRRLLSVAKDCLGAAVATQAYGGVFFRNNARPNVALKYPGRLTPEARRNLRESWERIHQGLDNAHRVAILEEGIDVAQMTINARDAQLIESRQLSLIDFANLLNLPPHKLGANVSTSYGSLEQENQNFLDDAIDPWLVAIEEECEAKLLSGYQRQRDTHAVAFDRFPLLRADLGERGEYYVKALSNGWLNLDEVRAREGENPIPGGTGRVYYRPAGAVAINADPDGTGPAVAPGTQLLDLPDVRQEAPYACGAAATRAVCQYFEVGPASEAEALAALGTTREGGTTPPAIVSLLSRLGLVVVAASEMEPADLAAHFAAGRPVLCPVQADAPGGAKGGHWVVVIGTGLGLVFVHDPAAGRRMFPEQEWLDRWHDRDAGGVAYDRYGIAVGEEMVLVQPAPEPAPDPEPKPAPDAADAARAVLLDAVGRVVRRVGHAARRAARNPGRFLAALDRLAQDHAAVCEEVLAAPLASVRAACGADVPSPEALAGAVLAELRAALLEASGEATPAQLAGRVDDLMGRAESDPSSLSCYPRTGA